MANRLASGLVALVLAAGVAGCGDDSEAPKRFQDSTKDGTEVTVTGIATSASYKHIEIIAEDGRRYRVSTINGHWGAGVGDEVEITGIYNSPCPRRGCQSEAELQGKVTRLTSATPIILNTAIRDRHENSYNDFGPTLDNGLPMFRYDPAHNGWLYWVRPGDNLTKILDNFRLYSENNRITPRGVDEIFGLRKGGLSQIDLKIPAGETLLLIPNIYK